MTQLTNGNGRWEAAVLAAGRGTRMRTALPKVLHRVAGRSLIQRVIATLEDANFTNLTIIRDPSPALPATLGVVYRFAVQHQADGTGGALRALFERRTSDATSLIVINADLPLITPQTLLSLRRAHDLDGGAVLTLLTCDGLTISDAGRIARSPDGAPQEIIEVTDPRHPDTPTEANAGVYAIDSAWAQTALPRLPLHNNGEYYITDLVQLAIADGHRVRTVHITDPDEAIGVNTLIDLARAEQAARRHTLETLMLSGVNIVDPASTYIDDIVDVAPNTIVRPNTHIYGKSVIGAGCDLGPDANITDSVLGEHCSVRASWLEGVTLQSNVTVGPFARLRSESHIGEGTHIGSFGEIKASRLGNRTAMGHFGYVGDSDIGDDVNIGAGAVTCNYDGIDKHRTLIGNNAFVGSGSMLIAPISIGARAYTAAGSVVTRDVAPDTTVVGVPAVTVPR